MTSSSAADTSAPAGRTATAIALLGGVAVVSVTFSVAVSSIAMGAAFLLLALAAARRGAGTLPATGLEAAFLLYVAAEVLSSVFSVDPADSFHNAKRVLLIGMAYLAAYAFRDRRRVTLLLGALAAFGAITSIVELIVVRDSASGAERPALFQIAMTEGGIRMLILLLVTPFALSRALPGRVRALFAVALLPILAGLVSSQTRSAWVAFAAGSLLLGTFWDRRVLAVLAVIVVLFALLAPGDFRSRALSVVEMNTGSSGAPDSVTTVAESNSSRIQMIRTGWKMFLDRPVLGWGDIGLRPYYVRYVTPLTLGEGGHLHNNLMESLVTLGTAGFCAVLWLFYRMFRVFAGALRGAPKDSLGAALAAGALASYAGFHVLGLFEYNFGDHEVMVLVWFITGLAVSARHLPGRDAAGDVR